MALFCALIGLIRFGAASDVAGMGRAASAVNILDTADPASTVGAGDVGVSAEPNPRAVNARVSPSAARSARDFIKSAAMPGGALATHPDRTYINPYLANFAAKGLLTSRVASDRGIALDYLAWYRRNSIDGYAMEYRVVAGIPEAVGDVDAQDSTAATFLSAYAAALPRATAREKKALRRMRPTVRAAVGRIVALQDRDGLTWAKPSWRVKHLMDQVEVYWGLSDIARVSANDRVLRATAVAARGRLRAGIAGLWDAGAGLYAVAKHSDGTVARADRTVAFPDVAAQVWVGATDIVNKVRLRRMLATTSATLRKFADPSDFWVIDGNREQVGYWPLVSVNYLRAGQVSNSLAFEATMDRVIGASGGTWPYHVGVAGMRLAPPLKTRGTRDPRLSVRSSRLRAVGQR